MTARDKVSGVNRIVALALALVWLAAGTLGIVLGVLRDQPVLVVVALVAVAYAALWLRVVARSRLLRWRELAAPWRAR